MNSIKCDINDNCNSNSNSTKLNNQYVKDGCDCKPCKERHNGDKCQYSDEFDCNNSGNVQIMVDVNVMTDIMELNVEFSNSENCNDNEM